jgi:hypothetical protein
VRDKARIGRILKKLERYWLACPDLRLAQIVVNASNATAPEVFHMEDDQVERYLDGKRRQEIKEAIQDAESKGLYDTTEHFTSSAVGQDASDQKCMACGLMSVKDGACTECGARAV